MAWKGDSNARFTGGSGQMAVIGELLHRKCNAAIPHVDVGTDVFAFRDDCEEVARIQVKTAPGRPYTDAPGYAAKFSVPMAQLRRTDRPPLFYAFAVRLEDRLGDFVVVSRAQLQELWNQGCGSENAKSGNLELYIRFRPAEIAGGEAPEGADVNPNLQARCGEFELAHFINAWESLPPLRPIQEIVPAPPQA